MTELVVVSLEPWDEVWRRNQYLVAGLLKEDPTLRVLFVEPPSDPLHDLRRGRLPRIGRRTAAITVVGGGRLRTLRAVKWLPRRWRSDADESLARAVLREATRLGFRHPLLWINDPRAAVLSRLSGWPTLYDMTDDWVAADRPTSERERLVAGELTLLETAAEVVACSPELVRRKEPARIGRPISLVRNAVDVAAYLRPVARPADLPGGRTAVYVGTVHADRFDVETAVATAEELRGHATVVLVGPLLLATAQAGRLRDAGVVTLGARSKDEVRGYLQHADVLIVPHVVDRFTDSLDPIKLYEYQVVGRPVVSSPVAGFRDAADPHIAIAEPTEFGARVLESMNSAAPFPEGAAPDAQDWSDRVRAFARLLAELRSNERGDHDR